MAYGFDLSKIPLQAFRDIIRDGYLIPSMRPLREGLDNRFAIIESTGVVTMDDLQRKIKNPKLAQAFGEATGLDNQYVTLLRRLVGSYKAKPRKLEEFPDIDEALYGRLLDMGIKTSKSLYEYLISQAKGSIADDLNVNQTLVETLVALMEVTQLRYVSPLFATAMVRAGYDSIDVVAEGNRETFLEALKKVNEDQAIYKGNIGDTDVQFLIDDAKVFRQYA